VILLFPILGSVLYLLLTIINFFPHAFNYLKEITEDNALNQYTLATKMIRVLKLSILLIFSTLTVIIHLSATYQIKAMGYWLLPLVLSIILLPIAFFIYKSVKK
jgi:hypothetical protein